MTKALDISIMQALPGILPLLGDKDILILKRKKVYLAADSKKWFRS